MIEVRDLHHPTGTGQPDWWAAYCTLCRRYVTKYEWTAEDARRVGDGHDHDEHGALRLEEEL